MAKGMKTGGRQKGTPNKNNQPIIDKLAELNCDPIEGMATIARKAMDEGEFILAGTMFKELAQYVAPKRKSVEMNTHVTFEERLQHMTEDELDDELRGYSIDPAKL
jgi:hypothetical protein|tara:strand:+ start:267 stop:584 length:318 start_codon:yes stop_codon:yes gene_type:complete